MPRICSLSYLRGVERTWPILHTYPMHCLLQKSPAKIQFSGPRYQIRGQIWRLPLLFTARSSFLDRSFLISLLLLARLVTLAIVQIKAQSVEKIPGEHLFYQLCDPRGLSFPNWINVHQIRAGLVYIIFFSAVRSSFLRDFLFLEPGAIYSFGPLNLLRRRWAIGELNQLKNPLKTLKETCESFANVFEMGAVIIEPENTTSFLLPRISLRSFLSGSASACCSRIYL